MAGAKLEHLKGEKRKRDQEEKAKRKRTKSKVTVGTSFATSLTNVPVIVQQAQEIAELRKLKAKDMFLSFTKEEMQQKGKYLFHPGNLFQQRPRRSDYTKRDCLHS